MLLRSLLALWFPVIVQILATLPTAPQATVYSGTGAYINPVKLELRTVSLQTRSSPIPLLGSSQIANVQNAKRLVQPQLQHSVFPTEWQPQLELVLQPVGTSGLQSWFLRLGTHLLALLPDTTGGGHHAQLHLVRDVDQQEMFPQGQRGNPPTQPALLTHHVRSVLERQEGQHRQQQAGQPRVPGVGRVGGRGHPGRDECHEREYRQPVQQTSCLLIFIIYVNIYFTVLTIYEYDINNILF